MKRKDFSDFLKSIDQAREINKTIKDHRAKVKIDKKTITQDCHWCNGKGIQCMKCAGTGRTEESIYYHTYKGKDGKMYCIDGDTAK